VRTRARAQALKVLPWSDVPKRSDSLLEQVPGLKGYVRRQELTICCGSMPPQLRSRRSTVQNFLEGKVIIELRDIDCGRDLTDGVRQSRSATYNVNKRMCTNIVLCGAT
jgi:hypothetical protein